jgi:probable addiction module antidote protein
MSTSKTKRQKSSDYKEFLLKRLRNPKAAAGYLTASLEEGEQTFLLAVKDVAEAYGGMGPLAKATKLNREGLYDMLSEKGNPRFSSLSTVLDALGIKVEFKPKLPRAEAA